MNGGKTAWDACGGGVVDYFKVCGNFMGGSSDKTAKKKTRLGSQCLGRISTRDILKKKKLSHTKNFESGRVANFAVIYQLPIIFGYV